MEESSVNYSNPRTDAVVGNWPTGHHRTTVHFWVETDPKRGQRACRTTKHPITGTEGSAKKLTYAKQVRIVDGNDGRTYVAALGDNWINVHLTKLRNITCARGATRHEERTARQLARTFVHTHLERKVAELKAKHADPNTSIEVKIRRQPRDVEIKIRRQPPQR